MMGFGLFFMLAVLAIPILLVAGLVIWLMKPGNQQNNSQPTVVRPPTAAPRAPSTSAGRVCSHCSAGLQPEWSHCPQCGAPTGQVQEAR